MITEKYVHGQARTSRFLLYTLAPLRSCFACSSLPARCRCRTAAATPSSREQRQHPPDAGRAAAHTAARLVRHEQTVQQGIGKQLVSSSQRSAGGQLLWPGLLLLLLLLWLGLLLLLLALCGLC